MAADGTFVLIMVETRPWDGSGERLVELQEKVNAYLAFALEGQLEEQYPESRGRPKRFQLDCSIDCKPPPDPRTAEFLDRVRTALAEHDIDFRVEFLD